MPLPFSFSGRVELTSSAGPDLAEIALGKLEKALWDLKATRVNRSGWQLHFTVRFFRWVERSNLLGPVERGELWLEPSHSNLVVFYRLQFTRLLMLISAGLCIPLGFLLYQGASIRIVPWFLAIGWLWLFGVNVAITLIRFPRWIRRTLK